MLPDWYLLNKLLKEVKDMVNMGQLEIKQVKKDYLELASEIGVTTEQFLEFFNSK